MIRPELIKTALWFVVGGFVIVWLAFKLTVQTVYGQDINPSTPTETPLHAAQAMQAQVIVPAPLPQLEIAWTGNANVTAWGLDESTNLLDWQSFAVVPGTVGQIVFQLSPTQSQMFFRIWPFISYNPPKSA